MGGDIAATQEDNDDDDDDNDDDDEDAQVLSDGTTSSSATSSQASVYAAAGAFTAAAAGVTTPVATGVTTPAAADAFTHAATDVITPAAAADAFTHAATDVITPSKHQRLKFEPLQIQPLQHQPAATDVFTHAAAGVTTPAAADAFTPAAADITGVHSSFGAEQERKAPNEARQTDHSDENGNDMVNPVNVNTAVSMANPVNVDAGYGAAASTEQDAEDSTEMQLGTETGFGHKDEAAKSNSNAWSKPAGHLEAATENNAAKSEYGESFEVSPTGAASEHSTNNGYLNAAANARMGKTAGYHSDADEYHDPHDAHLTVPAGAAMDRADAASDNTFSEDGVEQLRDADEGGNAQEQDENAPPQHEADYKNNMGYENEDGLAAGQDDTTKLAVDGEDADDEKNALGDDPQDEKEDADGDNMEGPDGEGDDDADANEVGDSGSDANGVEGDGVDGEDADGKMMIMTR